MVDSISLRLDHIATEYSGLSLEQAVEQEAFRVSEVLSAGGVLLPPDRFAVSYMTPSRTAKFYMDGGQVTGLDWAVLGAPRLVLTWEEDSAAKGILTRAKIIRALKGSPYASCIEDAARGMAPV